jgi:hypothetical protein
MVGLPDFVGDMCLEFFSNFETVETTFHSGNQLMEETKGGVIPLPTRADLMAPTNILVELYEQLNALGNGNRIMQKALIRVHHLNSEFDYSYVVARDGYIVSAWANAKTDIHRLKSRHIYFSKFTNTEVEIPEILREDYES